MSRRPTGGNRRASISGAPKKDQTCLRIEMMEAERKERRRTMAERKKARATEEERNRAAGNPGDVDFIGMVRRWRQQNAGSQQPHNTTKMGIAIRKRPLSDKERAALDHDAITCLNPVVWVHSAKLRVDGITKYLEHSKFVLDHAFDETCSTEQVYLCTALPLVQFCLQGTGGRATVFAFGQTGSGKTYTMQGIQQLVAQDFFAMLEQADLGGAVGVFVSSFELYGGSILDLLNDRQKLKLHEDGKGEVVVTGLSEVPATSSEELLQILDSGNQKRTTHSTQSNDTSSRSHAILQIKLRQMSKSRKLLGKLSLVDLAGSERWSDTKQHDSQRRGESADINTSLLALKECMRGLNTSAAHIPYRQSKLTLILKDCFTSDKAMTSMIATVSPGASSADHTVNTLRYAEHTRAGGGSSKSMLLGHTGLAKRLVRPKRPATRSAVVVKPAPIEQSIKEEQETNDDDDDELLFEDPAPRAEKPRQPFFHKHREEILNLHMQHLHETAELLVREKEIVADPSKRQELGRILDEKENRLRSFQQAVAELLRTDQKDDNSTCFEL